MVDDSPGKLHGLANYLENPPARNGGHVYDPAIRTVGIDWEMDNPNAATTMRNKYKLAKGDYARLLENQLGKCANKACLITHTLEQRLCVDHDHACCGPDRACGECVRGLLCSRCNFALGLTKDDTAKLHGLAAYLDTYRIAA